MQTKDYPLTDLQKSTCTSELWGEKDKTTSEIQVFSNMLLRHRWTKKEFGSKWHKIFLWLKFKYTKYHKQNDILIKYDFAVFSEYYCVLCFNDK